jgi:hypothetical protein
LLKQWEEEGLDLAPLVSNSNSNFKNSLMAAAQMRVDDDECLELLNHLVRLGAKVGATTRRGHTALIYACGRARNRTVKMLLAYGASPCVYTVGGDSAVEMGRGRLSEEVQCLLEEAEAAWQVEHGAEAWKDFRGIPDAEAAQMEHTRSCAQCREQLREKMGGGPLPDEPQLGPDTLASDIAARLQTAGSTEDVAAVSEALLVEARRVEAGPAPVPERHGDTEQASLALAYLQGNQGDRKRKQDARNLRVARLAEFRTGLQRTIAKQGVLAVLRAAATHELLAALVRLNRRDQLAVAVVTQTLVESLVEQPSLVLNLLLEQVMEGAEPEMAMLVLQLLHVQRPEQAGLGDLLAQLWEQMWEQCEAEGSRLRILVPQSLLPLLTTFTSVKPTSTWTAYIALIRWAALGDLVSTAEQSEMGDASATAWAERVPLPSVRCSMLDAT